MVGKDYVCKSSGGAWGRVIRQRGTLNKQQKDWVKYQGIFITALHNATPNSHLQAENIMLCLIFLDKLIHTCTNFP